MNYLVKWKNLDLLIHHFNKHQLQILLIKIYHFKLIEKNHYLNMKAQNKKIKNNIKNLLNVLKIWYKNFNQNNMKVYIFN